MPAMPSPVSASRTSSSLNGLMIARISFMMPPSACGLMLRCNRRAKWIGGGKTEIFCEFKCDKYIILVQRLGNYGASCLNFGHLGSLPACGKIGGEHVGSTVTNAHLVC